jgi:hypothetical protein
MATTLVDKLNEIQTKNIIYFMPIIYIFGIIFNSINIIIFSRRTMRLNACSIYFKCLSLDHIILLNSACLFRIISTSIGYDASANVSVICKIRGYLYILTTVLSRHFICLIAIDRWIVVSNHLWLRQQSSLRSARWIMTGSLLFWSLFSIHALIGFDANKTTCAQTIGTTYDLFYSIYNIIVSIVPLFIMILFSVLTVINVRLFNKRVIVPVNTINNNLMKQILKRKKNLQLIRLSIVQVIVYFILNIINSMYPLYSYTIKIYAKNIPVEFSLIANLINNIGVTLLYLYAAV